MRDEDDTHEHETQDSARDSVPRVFAIVPAAGASRRMGRPKLTLPLGDETVIERVLAALNQTGVTERVVVVRPDDEELVAAVRRADARCIQPVVAPPDMRASVQIALADIARRHTPHYDDAWMLTPGDSVGVKGTVVRQLLAAWFRSRADVLVPEHEHHRGHPALFRWPLAQRLRSLSSDVGVNALLSEPDVTVETLSVGDAGILDDLDTPQDYAGVTGPGDVDETETQ